LFAEGRCGPSMIGPTLLTHPKVCSRRVIDDRSYSGLPPETRRQLREMAKILATKKAE
jgi:hypothetical protein